MGGGEFRFGTASIYIAGLESIRPRGTSHKRVITWLRFETVRSSFPGLPPICSNGKKEARSSLICRRLPRASITSIPVQSAADWSILGVSEHEKNASLGSGVSDNTADHFTGERPVSRVRPNPEAYRNIQVNFCKRPGCPHFCVEPLVGCIGPGRRSGSDGYRLVGARAESALRCSYCGVESRIKSN